MTWKRKLSVSFEDFSQSWFLCLHPDVHIHHELVARVGYGGKVLHAGKHLNGTSLFLLCKILHLQQQQNSQMCPKRTMLDQSLPFYSGLKTNFSQHTAGDHSNHDLEFH